LSAASFIIKCRGKPTVSDIVQDSEGQEFVLETEARSGGHTPFGGQSLRNVIGRATSIRSIVTDSANRRALADAMVALGECSTGQAVSLSADELQSMVEAALASGLLTLRPFERSRRPICDNEPIVVAEALSEGMEEEVLPTHTLEIELVDEEDEPVANEPYQVELPGGEVVQGRLNSRGCAMLTGIESAGSCKVTFPRLDEAVWAPG